MPKTALLRLYQGGDNLDSFDKFRLRLNNSGGSIRQDRINATKNFMNDTFPDDPTYYVVPLNGIDTPMRIYDKGTLFREYGEKYIQLMDNALPPLGGYIWWNDRFWMITRTDESNELKVNGVIRECNYLLRWINERAETIERWCVFWDGTKYSSGESENQHLVIPNMRIEMFLPRDNETIKLFTGRRFIIDDLEMAQLRDPLVYCISKENPVERNRLGDSLFRYIMIQDVYNSNLDNREQLIADFYSSTDIYSLDIITPLSIEIEQGDTFQLQVKPYINNTPSYEAATYNSLDEDIVTVTQDGLIEGIMLGIASIEVIFHDVVKTIDVNVVAVQSQTRESGKIIYSGLATIRVGGTKTFTSEFFDDLGSVISDVPIWDIIDDDFSIPPYITISNQTHNSITLKCGSDISLIGKSFNLTMNGTLFGTVLDVINIEVVSLT